jgi:membrane protease subunit HflC
MSGRAKLVIVGIIFIVALIVVLSSTYKTTETEQAILLQFGEPLEVVNQWGEDEPGLRVKTPFVQNIEYFEKRIVDYDAPPEEIILGDKKRLVVDAFIRYRITDPLKYFQTVGTEGIARSRLGAILNAATREVMGRVDLVTVLSGERASLMTQIRDQVNRQSAKFGMDVIDVRIRRADLPDENSQAVYARMSAERAQQAQEFRSTGEAEKKRIVSQADREAAIILAEANRNSEIIRGQGDAIAARIFAQAVGRDPEFYAFYRSMQALTEALGESDTTMVLSPDSELFAYFGTVGEIGDNESQDSQVLGGLDADDIMRMIEELGITPTELDLDVEELKRDASNNKLD